MKKLFSSLSVFGFVILISTLEFGFSSCTKEVIKTDTLEVIVRDTVVKIDTFVSPKVSITDHVWKIDEIRILQNNQFFYYKLGGGNNTANFLGEYIEFKANFTGTYFSEGVTTSLTWQYKNEEKTIIEYTINYSTPLVITWEKIQYYEDYIVYSEYYKKGAMNSYSTGKRIPN